MLFLCGALSEVVPGYELLRYPIPKSLSLGKGLALVNKEFSPLLGRSLFLYDFVYDPSGEHILVVPANGEEFFFELYGVDRQGGCVLLLEMDF